MVFLLHFELFCSSGSRMGLCKDHCLCKSPFIMGFCTLGICHMPTYNLSPGQCYVCSLLFVVVLMRTWSNAIILGQVGLILFCELCFWGLSCIR